MDFMSTAQLLGNFGEFVGAIAVVATLGFLTLEIRRSRLTTLASIEMVRTEQSLRELLADRDSPYMASLVAKAQAGEALDEGDLYRIERSALMKISRLVSDYAQRRLHEAPLPRRAPILALRFELLTFGDPVREQWVSFKDVTPKDFNEWVESSLPELTVTHGTNT